MSCQLQLRVWFVDSQKMVYQDKLILCYDPDMLLFGDEIYLTLQILLQREEGLLVTNMKGGIYEEHFELQFCTSFEDSFGIKIYDGDILSVTFDSEEAASFLVRFHKAQGAWVGIDLNTSEKALPKYDYSGELFMYLCDLCGQNHCKVIGNKYENPNLLEEL